MSSPFSIFRRHQRVLMVVTTALAMISFVLLGAINDPTNIPTPLVILFFAAMAGGVGWLAGLSSGKAMDWGFSGIVIGVLIAVFVVWSGRESNAVVMDGGSLTESELTDLMRQRQIANHFVQMAIIQSDKSLTSPERQQELQQRLMQYSFGGDEVTDRDAVLGEVLRREADQMGIAVSDEAVTEYIKQMTANKMTADVFVEIRRELGVTERQLLDILKSEIRARQALELVFQRNRLTPQNFWDFYQKMNVTKSAQLVAIDVQEFIDQIPDPSDAEIQQFFMEYRNNYPNVTPEGQLEEGRPGFYQPRRVKLAYLEAIYDQIEATVDEVTDEEIQKRFDEEHSRTVPEEEVDPGFEIGNEGLLNTPLSAPATTPESPETIVPEAVIPATGAPEEEPEPEEETSPEADNSENDSQAEPETTDEPGTDASTSPESSDSEAAIETSSKKLHFVALQDETQATEENQSTEDAPAEVTESEETPVQEALPAPTATDPPQASEAPSSTANSEQPAQTENSESKGDVTESPVDSEAASPETASPDSATNTQPDGSGSQPVESTEEGTSNESEIPPAPESDRPVLTEQRKLEIRDEILRERTQAEIQKRMEAANSFVAEVGRNVAFGDVAEEGFISAQEATKKIQEYAKQNQLEYIATPYLSAQELQESEDYPVGSGFVRQAGFENVVTILFQSTPTDRFRPNVAQSFTTGSEYVFWKLGEKSAYVPSSLDDEPNLKQQVIEAWKMRQALPKASQRAEELAEKVRKSDQPMTEVLGDERVTKNEDSLFLTVQETGEFSWMTQGFAPSPNLMQQQSPPRISTVMGAPDAGQRFFKEVFETLNTGEVGVVPNRDSSKIYVVKILDQNNETPEELNRLRTQFLNQGFQSSFMPLGQQALSEHVEDLGAQLLQKYNVKMSSPEPDVTAL